MALLDYEASGRRRLGFGGVASGGASSGSRHPLHLKDARQRWEGSDFEKLLLKPVKLNALGLTAGLVASALWGTSVTAKTPQCTQNHTGTVANYPKHCRGENHMWSADGSCICPNPNNSRDPSAELTKKCVHASHNSDEFDGGGDLFTCEKP